ncbi:heavy metal sensor histidine kinase [Herbaspirillum sp. RTI4]|uniref:heavy metal sensor histidine kinase n=2 Tax=Pseudomonadati TaxID=3379134 RepID=UPI002AB42840|nr:heavy metal sensor histidine kinase [Herbaspirillum sp. RTI4]MDY7578482.1 heavy metal sensor histidine kinase [Herbaspirillum sp. RTI4]MEA9981489.1 heavy metal sensor histidine kinase [Herbaspirillum sp. RTI4]
MRHSITARLVLMFAAAALVIFSLIGIVLYEVVKIELSRRERDGLQTTFSDIKYKVEWAGNVERWARLQTRLDMLTPGNGKVRFWIVSSDPRFQYGKDLANIRHTDFGGNPNGGDESGDHLGELVIKGMPYPMRTLTAIIPALEDRPSIQLIVGTDTGSYYQTLHRFLMALISLSLLGVVLVVLFAYWVARAGLLPLKRLSDSAKTLSPKALSQRLDMSALPSELSDLAGAFNGALGRIENAYKQLESFNADVAHELRTPLANLIGETQVALSRERSADQFKSVLQSNLEELDRLRAIINDMLFLARSDQGEAATSLQSALIAAEVGKTIDFFEFVLDEMAMTVGVDGPCDASAMIETALFRRAMTNLLQNAIQHSSPGAHLRVSIARLEAAICITVSNPGLPIAEQHLGRLFDRFYRIDASRHDTQSMHGHGLGLAIVKAIAQMHGGMVSASNAEGFTRISFTVAA